jgi:hypothetical protein
MNSSDRRFYKVNIGDPVESNVGFERRENFRLTKLSTKTLTQSHSKIPKCAHQKNVTDDSSAASTARSRNLIDLARPVQHSP